jgi:predicted hydrocarbon binding protein
VDHYPPNNFERDYSFEEIGRLSQVLEEMYGAHSGRQLSRRIGRACFQQGIVDLRPVLGLADVMFRLLPLSMKLKVGVEVLARMFNKFSDHRVRLDEDGQYIRWIVERCGICWERTSDMPCCQLAVGLLEEGLYWVSGGETFYVEEVSCLAAGDPSCTLLVSKRPSE